MLNYLKAPNSAQSVVRKHKLKIAISQFPVSDEIEVNLKYITRHIFNASNNGADLIHFPETALSGYNMKTITENWSSLSNGIDKVRGLARKYKIYVIFGTYEKASANIKPYDSTYVISNTGEILGKYRKTKLYGAEKDIFSAEENYFVCDIKGVKCGFLICYDSCFPELFDYYRKKSVKLLLLSYYNAKSSKPRNAMDELMRAQFITRATDNVMYISGSNSSAKYSRMPASYVQPDGKIVQAKRHMSGILYVKYPAVLGWTYDNSI